MTRGKCGLCRSNKMQINGFQSGGDAINCQAVARGSQRESGKESKADMEMNSRTFWPICCRPLSRCRRCYLTCIKLALE